MKNIKLTYIVIIGLLIYILFLQECSGPNKGIKGIDKTVDTLKHTTDTIRITYTDTITLPQDTHYVTLPITTPYYIYDTIYTGGERVIDSTSIYLNPYEDSLISGIVSSEIDGTLISQGFTYTPKFPKYILKTDTVTINTTTTVAKKKNKLFIGAEIGGNQNTFNVSPIIDLQTKKGYIYGYRYGLVDKTHSIRFSKALSFKRKN
jgi:hypothetical protein